MTASLSIQDAIQVLWGKPANSSNQDAIMAFLVTQGFVTGSIRDRLGQWVRSQTSNPLAPRMSISDICADIQPSGCAAPPAVREIFWPEL